MRVLGAVGGLTALLLFAQAAANPAVSSGAEGFRADTPGGRGGRRIAVSTLADARLAREVSERSGRLIDSQKEVGGWPDYRAAGKLPGAR